MTLLIEYSRRCDFCRTTTPVQFENERLNRWLRVLGYDICPTCAETPREPLVCPECGNPVDDVYTSPLQQSVICTPCLCQFETAPRLQKALKIKLSLVLGRNS